MVDNFYDLVVHHKCEVLTIRNVDLDRYLYIELVNDIFEGMVDDSTFGIGMSVLINVQHPKSNEVFELMFDEDVLKLLEMYEGAKEIHL